jgi:hypothetical protein
VRRNPDDAVLAARLDALAEGFMQREQVPGAIAVVVSGDTTILRGYGRADLEAEIPASADDTRFEIGSITKLFTWIAVMMLVEEGAIGLGDDITPILPEGLVPGDAPLTLAQLMSHRPGFEESFAVFDDAIASLPRVEALAAAAPEQVFPRGEVTSYSNWGVALAGNVVETLGGPPVGGRGRDPHPRVHSAWRTPRRARPGAVTISLRSRPATGFRAGSPIRRSASTSAPLPPPAASPARPPTWSGSCGS